MNEEQVNPFVGPRTFEEADGRFYFGREREARELFSLSISEPLLLFYAQSGAGKSSILNTRLVPNLRAEGHHVFPVGRVGGTVPEGIRGIKNIFAFNLILSLQQDNTFAHTLTKQTINQYIQLQKKRIAAKKGSQTTFLIIDQFEEILTTNIDHWQERTVFFKQLGEAIRYDPTLWVILTLREDYVQALSPYGRYLPGRLKARYHMQRMKLAAAKEAIEKPAANAQRPFTPEATASLIENLSQIRTNDPNNPFQQGEFIEPVQLQVVCYQLWENLKQSPQAEITLADIEQVGDVDTALAQFYENALAAVLAQTNHSEIDLRNWFDRQLITSGGTRGTVYMGTTTNGMPNDIVRLLANQYLLRSEVRAGGTWYELVHDRFVDPILLANKAWRSQQHPVVIAAEEWDRNGRTTDQLWQGQQLEAALSDIDLTSAEPLIVAFLKDCKARQSQYDLEAARAKADAEVERAQAEAKSAKQARRRSRWLGVGIVFILLVTILALWSRNSAQRAQTSAVNQAETASALSGTAEAEGTRAAYARSTAEIDSATAQAAQQLANDESVRAENQKATAVAASTVAAQQRIIAATAAVESINQGNIAATAAVEVATQAAIAQDAGEDAQNQSDLLLTQGLAFNARSIDDSELSALLALEAYRINQRVGGAQQNNVTLSLLPVLNKPYFNIKLTGHDGPVTDIIYDPQDPQIVYSIGQDGTFRLWDLSQKEEPAIILQSFDIPLNTIAIAPDGGTVFIGADDGRVYIWSVENLTGLPQVIDTGHNQPLCNVDIDPDGNRLVTADLAGHVDVWSWRAENPNNTPIKSEQSLCHPVVFDELDSTLSIGAQDGTITRFPLFNLNTTFNDIRRIVEPITTLNAYPEGNIFAGAEGSVYIERNGQDIETKEHVGPVNSLAVAPNNRTVISAGSDGLIKVWEFPDFLIDTTTAVATLFGHEGPINAVAYAPDGRTFVSAGSDGSVRLWRIDTPTIDLEQADFLLYTPDGSRLLVVDNSTGNGRISLYDLTENTPQLLATTEEGSGIINRLILAPDGETVYAGVNGNLASGLVRPYNLSNITAIKNPIQNTAFGITDIALSPDGKLLAIAGHPDGIIIVKSLDDSGARLQTLNSHRAPVAHLIFTPDGNHLISATAYSSAFPESDLYIDPEHQETRLWDVANFEEAPLYDSEILTNKGASDLAISPDGKMFALAADDIQLWHVGEWEEPLTTLIESTLSRLASTAALGNYASIAFSMDNMGLAASNFSSNPGSGRDVGQLRYWRIDDLLTPPFLIEDHIRNFFPATRASIFRNNKSSYFKLDVNYYNDIVFDPTGGTMSVASDGETKLWPTLERLPQVACDQLHRSLTEEEWELYLGNEPYRDNTCDELSEEQN